ncbi:CHRD domain-containing protein [Fundidesulfovibrio terrae]|uniref:CHRD domain-containing protein n=1 Tax=Fundidesulfovibrio terrae TaxID=2922866 RepID=UPI001FAECBEA|nr:CHRD domain-containing protein [Fundidesulfovibrio terrae]
MIRILQALLAVLVLMAAAPNGFAALIEYDASLNGTSEVPPNASPATGFARVFFDIVAHSLIVHETFSGLLAPATAAHIHSPALPGVNAAVAVGFTGFPFGTTSGTYDHTFDTSDPSIYTLSFLSGNGGTAAGAEAALGASLAAGTAYVNIHNSVFPGGEIRGQLTSAVPEPVSMILLGSGLACVAGAGFRRRRR